ncbi:hypothetical protein [Brevirhabdus sp.]|uniref:hypothetical protein n=1 Tax=Brevirhabdus sp. TaxID=2004514 RepID=UPI0040585882
MSTSADALRRRPWESLPHRFLGRARRVPTMLSPLEQQLYFWLASEHATGRGEIVDLGAFAGGSTACLAAGHIFAALDTRLHAFDKFTASDKVKQKVLYANRIAPFEGEDILPLARELLKPWEGRVVFHKGEITEQGWDGAPIEILTLDASKIAEKTDRMAEMFFPALVPGHSVIVQQDYLHYSQPWVVAQMELLADHFDFVAFCPRDSMVYQCTRAIDAEALEAAETALLTDAELFDLIAAARKRHAGLGIDERFERMTAALRANPGQRTAWKFRAPQPA